MKTLAPSIPYVDLVQQHAALKGELLSAIERVIDRGQFILGEEVGTFERAFAELCQVRYAVGVNSGTDALILALSVAGVGAGDEVITVPNSFVASVSAIRLVGARPIFVDVRDDYTIDPGLVEAAITPRTRAILPVHLTGRPCEMDPLMALASQYGLAVIEDCAQAVAAEDRGRRVGSFGTGCFSLHPLKTLNACGDGGVVTTDDAATFERLMLMRNLGLRTRDDCVMWAGNSRLDTIQAAILLVKLKYLEQWTEARRRNARRYRENLRGLAGIVIPEEPGHMRAVYHTLVAQAERRDALRSFLGERGIGSAVHYPVPIHLSRAGQELGYAPGAFPMAERQASRIVSLPVYPELSDADIDRVCAAIAAFYEGEPA